jgi:hypothetical protein
VYRDQSHHTWPRLVRIISLCNITCVWQDRLSLSFWLMISNTLVMHCKWEKSTESLACLEFQFRYPNCTFNIFSTLSCVMSLDSLATSKLVLLLEQGDILSGLNFFRMRLDITVSISSSSFEGSWLGLPFPDLDERLLGLLEKWSFFFTVCQNFFKDLANNIMTSHGYDNAISRISRE